MLFAINWSMIMDRRSFLKLGLGVTAGSLLTPHLSLAVESESPKLPFKISLAQWSLNKGFFGTVKPQLDPLDFASIANKLGIHGLEYVNQFFKDKARDSNYLKELKKRADGFGCRSLLIMCDSEGDLGHPVEKNRNQTVDNHIKWLEAAKYLGCHSIRVNAYSQGSREEQLKLVTDGLSILCQKAQSFGLNVIVENHGGLSSDPSWLTEIMKQVGLPNVGTLPDFGNFGEYNPYLGVEQLMPYARGVSAKAAFNKQGQCLTVDYHKMMRIIRDAGWNQYVGIESAATEGISEMEAIKLTKALLEEIREQWIQTPVILGKSLDGWISIEGGEWTVENGVLTGRNGQNWSTNPEVSGSWIHYHQPVQDFRLEFQYQINQGGNSGVMFRSQLEKNPAFTGYEMQITSSQNPTPNKHGTPGAIYDVIAPQENAARAPGHWNTVTIIAQGSRIIVEMNHKQIVDTQLDRTGIGYIGFQNHDEKSVVSFRNIRLQKITT